MRFFNAEPHLVVVVVVAVVVVVIVVNRCGSSSDGGARGPNRPFLGNGFFCLRFSILYSLFVNGVLLIRTNLVVRFWLDMFLCEWLLGCARI